MKLAIMQPYLFPYIGYFQLINAVDKFVIYDDVNYIKGGWINRNNILVNNQKYLFTVTLDQPSPYKLINEISIKDEFSKFLKTIYHSYLKAPYYLQTNNLLKKIISFQERNLGEFIANSLKEISIYLEINTEILISSQLNKNKALKNKEKILHICELLDANQYINAIGGQELYSKKEFSINNIELKFIKSNNIIYKQFNHEFVPWLSIIDVMMFNSKEEIKSMLNQYELI